MKGKIARKQLIKRILFKMLINSKFFPSILFTRNPFKIYEFKELLRDVKFSGDELILDIGCGGGLQTFLLGRRCKKTVGIDKIPEATAGAVNLARYIREINVEFRLCKIENTKFKNECFDKIFSICVLEHVSNYKEVLKEAYRILKKNGQMIFSVDSLETIGDTKLLERHKKDHCVERYFKERELKTILEEIGFNKINIYPIFRSNYARRLFIEGIKNRFQYGYLSTSLLYIFLSYFEKKCDEKHKGLFLIIKCSK